MFLPRVCLSVSRTSKKFNGQIVDQRIVALILEVILSAFLVPVGCNHTVIARLRV